MAEGKAPRATGANNSINRPKEDVQRIRPMRQAQNHMWSKLIKAAPENSPLFGRVAAFSWGRVEVALYQ